MAGIRSFSLAVFGLTIGVQLVLVLGLMINAVAPTIAVERDRKTLDALLASEITAAEIILGAVGSGLLRFANGVLPAIPLVFFLAIDPRLAFLALAGVASTALFLASLAVAVSAGGRTAARSTSGAAALAIAWLWLPILFLLILPRIWPASAGWTAPIAIPLLDSSPVGIMVGLGGLLPRGPLVGSIARMIAYQSAASAAFIAWAILRLRPASRAIHDAQGRNRSRSRFRRGWRERPPCSDDPLLWLELHPSRASLPLLALGFALNAVWLGLVGYVLSWFAIPAFAELIRDGYAAGNPSLPDIHPVARALVGKFSRVPSGTAPGQARLEFNIVLRQATAIIGFVYVLVVAGTAAESIVNERERDTWPGLLATPLSGREILRAKMIGAFLRARSLAYYLLALWTMGLVLGSIHPLGFLASLITLVVSTWFLAAMGMASSLWGRNRNEATGMALLPVMLTSLLGLLPFRRPGLAELLLAGVSIPYQFWAAPLSREDLATAARKGVPPMLASMGVHDPLGPWIVAGSWVAIMTACGIAALLLTRAASRDFDRAVGRPWRCPHPARPGASG
ncbi:ABC transporter permease subunit [Tundrisphaera sp. TA3]|uniref:ABC transporter permease subunit n=1 Tax=Tundrisphaera sp. TA3 TaxID=3435775 RepID=UPI003EBF83E3